MKKIAVLAAVAAALSALVASTARAGLISTLLPSCGATTQPFAQWGDSDGYCAFANNGFESGLAGWNASGDVSVVSANEPWYVSGFGTRAVALGAGGSITSSPLPVGLLDPWARGFVRSAGANGALRVQILFRGLLGNLTGILNVADLAPGSYTSWAPSAVFPSLLALPLGTSSAQVRITSLASSGQWQVDDVYLDPMIVRGS
ncbi:MAG: hypothetical protein JOZ56_08980 [Actinobacteria bacterium]|nr:hypothetical protein [Actinomycetota bacterium]